MSGPEISAIPKEARAYQGQSAGVVSRVVANTIDAAVVGAIVGAIYLGYVSVTFLLDPLSFIWPDAHLLASLTATLAMATFYLFVCWWLLGRTYGGHVMGLRVVGRRGRRLGPLRSLMRAGFCVFFPIGLFWCVISPERRSVQDLALWTRVVYDWMPRPGASQRKTLLGDAPMALGPAESHEPPAAGGSLSAAEMPDVAPVAVSDAPARRHRWSRDADSGDD
ncbi:MAG: RDD family protein [Ornithinibacter sp.]